MNMKNTHEKKCDEFYQLVKSKFLNKQYGGPEDYNDDLPLQLSEILDT